MAETCEGLWAMSDKLNHFGLDKSPAKSSASDGLRNRKADFFEALYYKLAVLCKINKMKNGVVKFHNEVKGFGFIKEDNSSEIFVHATGFEEKIRENDNVVFEVQEDKKGLNAVNVKLA